MKEKIGIAVLVSGGGTNLQALIDAEKSGALEHGHIVAVISSQRDAYALERARIAGIPGYAFVRKELRADEFERRIAETVDSSGASLIILAGFMSILSENFVKKYPDRIINIHPALIPSFCGKGYYGLRVHEEALKRGVKITGATVHFVNEIPDGGRIIMQKAVRVRDGDTPEKLQKRVMRQAEWIIYPKAAEKVCRELIEKEKNNGKVQS